MTAPAEDPALLEVAAALEALPRPTRVAPDAFVIDIDLDRDKVLWSDGKVRSLFAHRERVLS